MHRFTFETTTQKKNDFLSVLSPNKYTYQIEKIIGYFFKHIRILFKSVEEFNFTASLQHRNYANEELNIESIIKNENEETR